MELKIDNLPAIPAATFNFEELKQELTVNLEKYKGLVYTKDTIKNAKEDRATLNKLAEAIDTRRKEIKALYLEPYNSFEKQIKELEALIEEPKMLIDKQIKDFEEQEKEQKKSDIEFFFRSRIGDLVELLKFDMIFNSKWLNKTYKFEDIHKEIQTVIERTKTDFKVIEDLKTEFESTLKDIYLKEFDLSKVMQEKTRLEEQKQKMQAIKEQKEQEKKQVVVQEQEELQQLDFRVWVNKEQLNLLAKFLKDNNIKYGKVE